MRLRSDRSVAQHVVHLPQGRYGIRTTAGASGRTGAVLVNSGVVDRTGANRNTVHLARALALAGVPTLRFDMSGIGDAPDRPDDQGWERSSPTEISEAVTALLEHDDLDEVVLYGNCGGAAKSFWTARQDERVTRLLVTNPPPPPDDPVYGEGVEYFAHGRLVSREQGQEVPSGLSELLDRNVRVLFVYAAGDVGESYFHDRLAAGLAAPLADGRLTVARIEGTNHTLATAPARARLLRLATSWLVEAAD
jgi:pimeloyl-ACP methyl ester carboxylesterase